MTTNRGGITGANFLLDDLDDDIECRPVNLTAEDGVATRGLFYRLRGTSPTVGVHLMHPRTDQSQNYTIPFLVRAGFAVLGRAGRCVNNDVNMLHEEAVLDVAGGVRFLRDRGGCERVVLLGNSGGGSLAAFYQAEAQALRGERCTSTPAGDPLDLNEFDLPAADGLVLIGAHIGQGSLLSKWIDPSVVDEGDVMLTDPAFDMYSPENGFDPASGAGSYSEAFVVAYRRAQVARVHRLDVLARDLAADRRRPKVGWHMIVYRTTADLAFTDLSIEPDDRTRGSYNSGRPDVENYGEHGFCRYVTPRAWLSTWSGLSSRAATLPALERISTPLLVVHYAGDAGTRLSEAQAMHDRAGAADRSIRIVRQADHYGFRILADGRRGERTTEGVDAVTEWIEDRMGSGR